MSKVVGVEITSDEIRAVVASSGKRVVIHSLYTYEISPGLVVEGNVIDVDFLANELSKMWRKYRLPRKKVILAISNKKIIVRKKTFSNIEKDNIKSLLTFLVEEDDIPMSVDEVTMDFYLIEERPNRLEGLLVSAPSSTIEPFVKVFRKEKIVLNGINPSPLALINSLTTPENSSGKIAIIDLERAWTSITLVNDGVPHSIRFVSSRLSLLFNEIEELMEVDSAGVLELFENIGIATVVSTEKEKDLVLLIHQRLKDIYRSISETLRYFNIDLDKDEYDLVFLTGIGSLIKNIESAFADSLSTDVIFGDPFVNVENKKVEESRLNMVRAAVPIGLILGGLNG